MRTRRSISIARASRLASRDDAAMAQEHLDDLVADRVGRVERGHRLLEDHRHAVAAQVAQRASRHAAADRGPRSTTRPRISRRALRQQAHDRRARSRSCRSPISPTMPSVRPRATREADAVDRVRDAAVVAGEDDAADPRFEQRRQAHALLSRSAASAFAMPASIASRSMTPAGSSRVGRNLRKCT